MKRQRLTLGVHERDATGSNPRTPTTLCFNQNSIIMEYKTLSRKSKKYAAIVAHFQKQYNAYGRITEITKLHVNEDNKVIGGDWTTEDGVIHLTGGTVIDAATIITII